MLESTIAAARGSGARILLPGSVYNYGPDAGAVIAEDAPQHPRTRKGKIRAEVERRLARAADGGVRSLVLRGGDFFGGDAPGSWLQNAMVKPGKPVRQVVYPGDHDVGHAWAYLPDMARAAVALATRESALPAFDTFHFEGHYLERGVDFADMIVAITGARAKIGSLPWPAVAALSPFNETFRELLEMRYLWRTSLKLDGAKLRAALGVVPHTPLATALEDALRGLGCLPDARTALAHA